MSILIPSGIGALATVICLSKAVNALFDKYYSLAFHAIVGIVLAATIMIVPLESLFSAFQNGAFREILTDVLCIGIGAVAALLLDDFNHKVSTKK